MVVLILESVSVGLRGELSKWMLEPKAGVFVGTISGAVRDLLWEKACREVGDMQLSLIRSMIGPPTNCFDCVSKDPTNTTGRD